MGNQDKEEPVLPVGYRAIDETVTEPQPEEGLTAHFEPPVPPSRTFLGCLAEQKVLPAKAVEIEAAKEKDRVIQVLLILQSKLRYDVEFHYAIIICATEVCEKAVRYGKDRHVLNVRIMFRRIGHNVMDIMIALPPSQAKTPKIVCNNNPNYRIDVEVVRYTHMSRIMGSEHKLVPKKAQEEARCAVPTKAEEKE
jgi:hypothetical protein